MLFDVHHHFYPPEYMAVLKEVIAKSPNEPPFFLPNWSVERSVEEIERTNTTKAALSISQPGLFFGDIEKTKKLVRLCNDYGAALVSRYPSKFVHFAALPLPDVEASLAEIAYAFDDLHAQGIALMSNVAERWPGDEQFAPIFEELNRRSATVFVHPRAAECCGTHISYIRTSLIEWTHDTSRAILSLLFGGTLARCPNLKFIFAHGGGTMPYLAGRVNRIATGQRNPIDLSVVAPQGIDHELKRLYYDCANACSVPTMAALRAFAGVNQIVFGSDFPFFGIAETKDALAESGLSHEEQMLVADNGSKLLTVDRSRS